MRVENTCIWFALATILLAGIARCAVAAEGEVAKPADTSDTDRQLLDDLQNDLLEGIDLDLPNDAKAPTPAGNDKTANGTSPADSGGDEDPLTAIGRRMLDVGARLAREDSSTATQDKQKKILADLEKLIENAQRQRGSSSAKGGNSAKTTAPKKLAKKSGGNNDASARAGATVESTERLGKAAAKKVDPKEIRDRIEATWGVLPEQVREQMRHAGGDDFLGEYELMIENYFKRLAERAGNRP